MNRDSDVSKDYTLPKEYYSIVRPKQDISRLIRKRLQEKNYSYRQAAELIEDMNYTSFSRITSGENYTIDNLLKALDILDLEITINYKKINQYEREKDNEDFK